MGEADTQPNMLGNFCLQIQNYLILAEIKTN